MLADTEAPSKTSQPGFDFIVRHHVVRGEQTLLREEHDSPAQPGATLEQIFPQPPNSQAGVQVGTPETVGEHTQRFRNLIPICRAQFRHAPPQAGVEIDPHSLPVKGLVLPEARAPRTSAFTAL